MVVAVVVGVLAVVLGGVAAGVFFAYSNSVVPGLDRVPGEGAAAGMNSINVVIVNPLFLLAFLGSPVAGAGAGTLLLVNDANTGAWLFFGGALIYFLGAVLPTARVNVPLNNALADHHDWARFSRPWLRSNHWRTAASVAALTMEAVALAVA